MDSSETQPPPASLAGPANFIHHVRGWRHSLKLLLSHSPMSRPLLELVQASGDNSTAIVAPLCAAYALDAYRIQPAEPGHLRIALLGSQGMDVSVQGRLYQLIPWFLGNPTLKISVELIGLELDMPEAEDIEALNAYLFAVADHYPMSAGEWLGVRSEAQPLPDVIFLFHPGFERHLREWLAPGELCGVLALNRPVIVFPFDEEEAALEQSILQRQGAAVGPVLPCPLGVDEPNPHKQLPIDELMFARAMYSLAGPINETIDERFYSMIETWAKAHAEVYRLEDFWERHEDAFRGCFIDRTSGRKEVAHVFGRIYFDDAAGELFVAEDGQEIEDSITELAANGIGLARPEHLTPLVRALQAAQIFRLYKPEVPAESELFEAPVEMLLRAMSEQGVTADAVDEMIAGMRRAAGLDPLNERGLKSRSTSRPNKRTRSSSKGRSRR